MIAPKSLSPSLFRRLIWREIRGSHRRFGFFVLCLAVGVAAIVCVAGLSDNLDRRIRERARQLLGADLTVAGLEPISPAVETYLGSQEGLRITAVREMVTMAVRPHASRQPGRSQIVELKVIDGEYPFYGSLETSPAESLDQLLRGDGAVAAPDLLRRLNLAIGDVLRIGDHDFRITAELLGEPDRIASPFSLGPRVLVGGAGFERTGLERRGSRIVYRRMVRIPEGAGAAELERLAGELRRLVGKIGPYRIETYVEAQEELRRALERAANFLGLVALLSLLLGGLGIAQTTRAWLTSRMDDIAILRCLGLRPAEVVALYLAQTALLALVGSGVGVAAGVAVQSLLPRVFSEVLAGARLELWQPTVFARGLGLGLGVALIFSTRALLSVRSVPPLRVLRQQVEPLARSRWLEAIVIIALCAATWAVAAIQADSPVRGAQFTIGLALAAAILGSIAAALMRLLGPLARRIRSLPWRHGLLALARPGAATVGAVVSLGIGVILILGLRLVESSLTDQLRHQIPADSPTAFLVNIQPDQWPEMEELLVAERALHVESVPFVNARLRAIDDIPVEDLADESEEESDRQWALRREQRLTYMDRLPDDNRVIAGELWSEPLVAEVSVEEEFARDLGVDLGAKLRFDIQGVPLELLVTSIRSVEWKTFGINFFLVVEPGVLDEAPYQRVATATLPPDTEQRIQDLLADRFPNVTLLKIREVLDRIVEILGYLARGIGFIGAFTAVAGVVILAGAVGADSVRRRQQIALLKTLGLTRGDISVMLAAEFSVVGAIAGIIGAAGGSLLSWAVVTRGLELDWRPEPWTLALAIGLTLALTTLTGILSSRKALQQPPAAVLRGE